VVNVTAMADGNKIGSMKITVVIQLSFQTDFNCTFLLLTLLLGQVPATICVTNTSLL